MKVLVCFPEQNHVCLVTTRNTGGSGMALALALFLVALSTSAAHLVVLDEGSGLLDCLSSKGCGNFVPRLVAVGVMILRKQRHRVLRASIGRVRKSDCSHKTVRGRGHCCEHRRHSVVGQRFKRFLNYQRSWGLKPAVYVWSTSGLSSPCT
jgi:hypothetical protein